VLLWRGSTDGHGSGANRASCRAWIRRRFPSLDHRLQLAVSHPQLWAARLLPVPLFLLGRILLRKPDAAFDAEQSLVVHAADARDGGRNVRRRVVVGSSSTPIPGP